MRARLAAAATVTAAIAALALPTAAQAAALQSSAPTAAAAWVIHSGPYGNLSACEIARDLYGYNDKNAYCNQLFIDRWYLIVWK